MGVVIPTPSFYFLPGEIAIVVCGEFKLAYIYALNEDKLLGGLQPRTPVFVISHAPKKRLIILCHLGLVQIEFWWLRRISGYSIDIDNV